MIGLSVSFCIRDIVSGTVPLAKVQKIIGGTSILIEQGIDEFVKYYCQVYWHEYAEEAERVFRQILAEGKIEQPRLLDKNHFPNISNGKLWVENEQEIVWQDQMESSAV